MEAPKTKIPVLKFLKILVDNSIPASKAMAIAGKIYPEYNTPAALSELTDVKIKAAGVDSQKDRRHVAAAFLQAGYAVKRKPLPKSTEAETRDETASGASPSTPTAVQIMTTPKRKRQRKEDVNEFLPDGPVDTAASCGNLEFNEVMDEHVLLSKSTWVNRAPLMTAWAALVAERMNFKREEALSIASVYTELNATSKGISLGIYDQGKGKGLEASLDGSQPYVELMGRRPLYRTQEGQWRALSKNAPVKPSTAFSYISCSLRQTTPYIMGALRLLADSFTPEELNINAWSLYADFRPVTDQWGEKAQVRCETILALRKNHNRGPERRTHKEDIPDNDDGPVHKKAKVTTVECHEASDSKPPLNDTSWSLLESNLT